MGEPSSILIIVIVVAALGAIFLALWAVTAWAAPRSTGPRRPLPMFTSPTDSRPALRMFRSPETAVDAGSGNDGAHQGSAGHSSDGGSHSGDAGDGGH